MIKEQRHGGKKKAGPRSWLAFFVSFVRRQTRSTLALVVSVAIACVVMAVVIITIVQKPLPEASATPTPDVIAPAYRHPLTGSALLEEMADLPQVFGVMIENSSEAWPLTGLEDAFLVIEAPVEAAIPRFIAFFSEEAKTEKIGPVRSARPYYLDWAHEFGAVYAHVGGSPEALGLLDEIGIHDLDEFFQSEYFYRDSSRIAPHNAYTTMEDLVRSLDELELDAPTYGSWSFKDGKPSGEAKSLAIDWTSSDGYDVTWEYSAELNAYTRLQGGIRYLVQGRKEIIAQNVVVMESDVEVVDATGRRHIRTLGEGKALIAQDGRVIVGTWKKDSREDRLRFYDDAGNEMQMNAGKTWIEVVPSLGQATVTETEENTAL